MNDLNYTPEVIEMIEAFTEEWRSVSYSRKKPSNYRPLHRPLVPVKAGASQARKAETYRSHPDRAAAKLPTRYIPVSSEGKYSGSDLRAIRAVKGVGRPISGGIIPFAMEAAE